jgi:type VI secretion system secreted protein Hcp
MPVFLKYSDIKGDVTEPAHRSWIELTSVQLPANRSSASEIIVSKMADSASTGLFRESVNGQGVPAVIDFVRDDGTVYLRIEMSGTMIASYSVSGTGDSSMETLTLNFTKLEFKSTPGTPAP